MEKNIKSLGQVFTSDDIVLQMISLIQNKGNILEPSCGDGAFFNKLQQLNDSSNSSRELTGIEYDIKVCPPKALNIDFFDYSVNNKFDTIIGNPPYVQFKKIIKETKDKLDLSMFNERTNLYLYFIEKSIHHLKDNGELIFIVPRDFIKASGAIKLNKFIYENGTITNWIDFGDKIIFPGFSPNCVIFRFEKNNFTRKTIINNEIYIFKEMHGQLIFTKNEYPINFSDLFFVKVGAASGLDEVFNHENGNQLFISSVTKDNGILKRMFYNTEAKELFPFKEKLKSRKIRKFTEKNWYMWGRNYFDSELPRIYVNVKTRKSNPFFINSCNAYDGSILAIFPKFEITKEELNNLTKELNQVNWNELGFICDGRYLFSQRSLEQANLPKIFEKYIIK